MADCEGVSSALVRDYFIKNGGKVKRHDLFDHFRRQLDECSDQGKLKNQFGDIVNSLAVLQNIEGEKFFVLRKTKNGSTSVPLRRTPRGINQRKEKGASLPANMRNFRFSAAEDAFGNIALTDNRLRATPRQRPQSVLRIDPVSSDNLSKRNGDTSVGEHAPENDSGVDTAVSSLQSESPKLGSRDGSLPRNADPDQLSQYSADTGISGEDDQYDHELPSHTLSGLEKSWMMSSMTGDRPNLICQLEEDPNIVFFKDFITGYTALHWAAKQGNEDILRLLVAGGADVNAKSNGGYTPLHLASMHGQINIINILIDEYHVDVHIRDHSGKEAKHLVKKNASDRIKQKLRDPAAAIVLQDLDKKLPSASSGKMTPHIKKLGKILSRKHHNSNSNVDGEVRCKIQRSLSDSMGSQEDDENILELGDVIFADKTISNTRSVCRRSLSDPMGSQETLEDTTLTRDGEQDCWVTGE